MIFLGTSQAHRPCCWNHRFRGVPPADNRPSGSNISTSAEKFPEETSTEIATKLQLLVLQKLARIMFFQNHKYLSIYIYMSQKSTRSTFGQSQDSHRYCFFWLLWWLWSNLTDLNASRPLEKPWVPAVGHEHSRQIPVDSPGWTAGQ